MSDYEYDPHVWAEALALAAQELADADDWDDNVIALGKLRETLRLYRLARAAHRIEVGA